MPEGNDKKEVVALTSEAKPVEIDEAADPSMNAPITPSNQKKPELNESASPIQEDDEPPEDKKDDDDSQPVAKQTTELPEGSTETGDATSVTADREEAKKEGAIGLTLEKEPEALPQPTVSEAIQNDSASSPEEKKVDTSDPMDIDVDVSVSRSSPSKPENRGDDAEVIQEDLPMPSQDKSSDVLATESVEIFTPPEIPVVPRPTFEEDLRSRITRYVTDETEPPAEVTKTAAWKPLSASKLAIFPKAVSMHGMDENKINRVKMLLFSLGSQVHRGKGFERLFADYWAAVCLRLSDRLRIMRRSTRVFAKRTDLSSHIPVKWRDRVKTRAIETITMPKSPKVPIPDSFLEKDFLSIGDVPHPVPGRPYKEPWQVFDDEVDSAEVDTEQSIALDSLSRCIPGAMVVDPVLREAAAEKGLESSDSATWLLTVAVREHAKNVLKGSIAHKKSLEKGEVHPKFLHYPNILASNAKKDGKHQTDTSVPPIQTGDKKTRISAIDIFSASRGLPAGQIGSMGGAISRFSLEQSLQSAFHSMPPFFAGKDFKQTQNFVANEIFDIAQVQEQVAASAKLLEKPPPSESAAAGDSRGNTKTSQGVPSADDQKTSPSAKLKQESMSKDGKNDTPTQQKDGAGNEATVTSPTGQDTLKSTEPSGQQQPQRPSVVGAGRGAKNLRALMARASSESKKEDESATVTSTKNGDDSEEGKTAESKGGNDDDTVKADPGEAKGKEVETSNSEKAKDKANPDQPADKADTENPAAEDTKPPTPDDDKKSDKKSDAEEKTPQEASPQKSEGATPSEPTKDTQSTVVGDEDEESLNSPGMPKGKGAGSKNLAAMRARSTTSQSDSDGNKEEGTK
ncbi:MAG: hypothetical protein SGARI_000680 [Bacillariaceae sp.]